MKKYFFSLLLLVFATIVDAQDNRLTLGIGGGFAFAQGNFKEWATDGHSLNINILYNINNRISTGLEGNFTRFEPKYHEVGEQTKIHGVSLKGLCYFQVTKVKPYGAIMVGLYNNTFMVPSGYDGDAWDEAVYSTRFGGGVLFGVNIKKFNVELAYYNLGKLRKKLVAWEQVSYIEENIGFIQLRVGLSFSFFEKKN